MAVPLKEQICVEHQRQQRLAGEDAVARLLEVVSVRRFIHVGGDLVDARQRVQHLEVGARAGQIRSAQHELRLHVGVLGRIEALFLYPVM